MNHAMDLCNFPRGHLCTLSGALTRMDCSLLAACLSMKCSHRYSSAILEWERKNGHQLHVCCDRGENCKHLPLYTSLLLSTDSNLPCVLSTLTDFSVLLLLTGAFVMVLSFLASKLRALMLRSRNFFTVVLSLW